MTLADMRALLGLGPSVSDAAVASAYAAFLAGDESASVQPPISLAEAKRQLRLLDGEGDNDEIAGHTADAIAWVERYTGHILIARDITERFGSFDRLQLRAWPIKPGATVAVGFVDSAGAAITIASTRLLVTGRKAQVLPAIGTRWPPVGAGAITVTVRAGYEVGEVIPGNLRRAVLVMLAAYDADREGGEVFAAAERTARSLCTDFRFRTV